MTYEERLEAAGAIDLRDNHIITRLPNGYDKIEPIDPTRLFKVNNPDWVPTPIFKFPVPSLKK